MSIAKIEEGLSTPGAIRLLIEQLADDLCGQKSDDEGEIISG